MKSALWILGIACCSYGLVGIIMSVGFILIFQSMHLQFLTLLIHSVLALLLGIVLIFQTDKE